MQLSQVPLAEVQAVLQQRGIVGQLQAQQVNWGQRQRSAAARLQQQQARNASGAAPQEQEPGPVEQQQPAAPRRSARVAAQQGRQQQAAPQQQQQQAAPQQQQPAPQQQVDGRAALQPVAEGPAFPKHDLGPRLLQCTYCSAKLWAKENQGSAAQPHGGSLCCYKGDSCGIQHTFQPPPPRIRELFTSASTEARRFRKHARLYNSALQMASSGLVDIAPRQGASVIAIRGAVHHLLGPLAPAPGQQHQFAQLYIIDDAADEVQSRIAALGQAGAELDAELLADLQQCLHTHNTYVREIKQVKVCVTCVCVCGVVCRDEHLLAASVCLEDAVALS